jgi:hypothetical protein
MTYSTAVCTVKNSWWWTEELSETCRVLFQKQIWEISASSWFYYNNLSRCTVTWTSIYHDARSPDRQFITMHGQLNVKFEWSHILNFGSGWLHVSGRRNVRNTQNKILCTLEPHCRNFSFVTFFFCGHSFISFQQQFMTCTCTRLSQINVSAPCNLYYGPTFWKPPLPTHGTKTVWVGDLMLTSRVFFILSTSHIFSPNRCPLTSQNACGPVRNSEFLEREII